MPICRRKRAARLGQPGRRCHERQQGRQRGKGEQEASCWVTMPGGADPVAGAADFCVEKTNRRGPEDCRRREELKSISGNYEEWS